MPGSVAHRDPPSAGDEVPGLPPDERRRTSVVATPSARYIVHGGRHSELTRVDAALLAAVDGLVLEGCGRALGPATLERWRTIDPQYRCLIEENLAGPRRPVFLGDVPLYRPLDALLPDYRSALVAEKVASHVGAVADGTAVPTVFVEYGVGHTDHSPRFRHSIEGFLRNPHLRRRFLADRLPDVYARARSPVSRAVDRLRGRTPAEALEAAVPGLWEVWSVTVPPGADERPRGRTAYDVQRHVLTGLREVMTGTDRPP